MENEKSPQGQEAKTQECIFETDKYVIKVTIDMTEKSPVNGA